MSKGNDKNKTLVVGALLVVLVGVGAFQMLPKGGGGDKKLSSKKTDVDEKTYAAESGNEVVSVSPGSASGIDVSTYAPDAENSPFVDHEMLLAMGGTLPQRDPFKPGTPNAVQTGGPNVAPPQQGATAAPTTPRYVANQGSGSGARRPSGSGGGSRPRPLDGNLAPWNPNGGTLPGGDIAANVVPSYSVSGVVLGSRPMAVFRDSAGNQRLVELGGQVDPDTRVVGIERGRVRIKTNEGEKTLNLEGKSQ